MKVKQTMLFWTLWLGGMVFAYFAGIDVVVFTGAMLYGLLIAILVIWTILHK
jgi:hypothetical protein